MVAAMNNIFGIGLVILAVLWTATAQGTTTGGSCNFLGETIVSGSYSKQCCFRVKCDNSKLVFEGHQIVAGCCKKSSCWGDPHCTTFTGCSYTTQELGTFTLVQDAKNANPRFDISSTFEPCGKGRSCIVDVTIRDGRNTVQILKDLTFKVDGTTKQFTNHIYEVRRKMVIYHDVAHLQIIIYMRRESIVIFNGRRVSVIAPNCATGCVIGLMGIVADTQAVACTNKDRSTNYTCPELQADVKTATADSVNSFKKTSRSLAVPVTKKDWPHCHDDDKKRLTEECSSAIKHIEMTDEERKQSTDYCVNRLCPVKNGASRTEMADNLQLTVDLITDFIAQRSETQANEREGDCESDNLETCDFTADSVDW